MGHADATISDGASSDLLQHLQAYIPGDRRRALARGETLPDRVRGAALFADISGFTPLTEALASELGAHRGAEELTKHLNRVFEGVISELHRYSGEVIYFSGDAITCWFDGDDGYAAATCALAMQGVMRELHDVVTPGGQRVTLAMKVAVAIGNARRFVVGDPDIQLIDVLAGQLIDALATAEHHAQRGEVVLDHTALDGLQGRVSIGDVRVDGSGHCCAVLRNVASAAQALADQRSRAEPLVEEVARRWVLPALYERLRSGGGEFLTELRPAYPVFARFGGIDYDADDHAPAKLDDFVTRVQRVFFAFGGSVVHLSVGDKGAYLYGVFGSPIAHEDDAARAASAALELRELPGVTAVDDLQIGVTYGRLRSGLYGHSERQAFTCLGDAVNLAARLMSNAPQGAIYASAAVRDATRDAFVWQELAPITVKGKREPVSAFALSASRKGARRSDAVNETPMVGRKTELARLAASVDSALAGHGSAVGISAEAGMGKSRLIAEFARETRSRAVRIALGECQAFGRNTSYFAWREIWRDLFGIVDDESDAGKVLKIETRLRSIDGSLVARAPLLSSLLDVSIPDNELTASFDAKLRKTSLETLLADCLRAHAKGEPLAIVLEDCHWLDALSRDLLEVLARTLSGLPCLFVLAYRPASDIGGGLGLTKLDHFQEIALSDLGADEAASLIEFKLRQIFGAQAEPSAALLELVTARARGNPFYIEELLNFIRSKGVDPNDARAVKSIDLPDSLHSLLLSRIDGLPEAPRRTLKVASVIGRVFRAPMVGGVYPELGSPAAIADHLTTLTAADLVHPEIAGEQSYLFKHVVTQEVAYESMPFSFRSTLHERIGRVIEETETDAIDRHLDLLAHHYWHSDNLAKKREYLARAGTAAQAAYANAAAIDYFERLAPLVTDRARIDVLLKLGKVLELVGQWKRAEEIDLQALSLAHSLADAQLLATCETALAEVARKQGRFDEALARLDQAAAKFQACEDQGGIGRIHHLRGTIAGQRGDYDTAAAYYARSLQLRERLGDTASMGSLLSNLGVLAEYRGDFDGSRAYHERAIALRTEVGDRAAIAVSMNNLGMISVLQRRFEEARATFERSLSLSREVGDMWMVAIGHNNLGNATRGLGDYEAAGVHYAETLRAYRHYDDPWAMAFLLEDIGVLAAQKGDAPSALELIGAAEALRQSSGTPRAPSLEQELSSHLQPVCGALTPTQQNMFRERGRSMQLAEAFDAAMRVCATQDRSGARARPMASRAGPSRPKPSSSTAFLGDRQGLSPQEDTT